jgi:hypothetical protein
MIFQAGIWALGVFGCFGAKVVESTVWTERRLSVHFTMCSPMKLSLWLQGNQAPIHFEQQHQLNGLKRLPLQSISWCRAIEGVVGVSYVIPLQKHVTHLKVRVTNTEGNPFGEK